jgi:crossover junction endodeoxyribonuclease RuvC
MRIIGIDPGTVCCGYGVVEVDGSQLTGNRSGSKKKTGPSYVTAGDIRLKRNDSLPERLKFLFSSLKKTIDEYKPAHLCLEKIFYHKSIRSALTLGSTRGIAMLLAAQYDLPVYEYNPTELKMAITGYGRAEKQQVREMVMRILHLDPSSISFSEDSSDALALCICHVHSYTTLDARGK